MEYLSLLASRQSELSRLWTELESLQQETFSMQKMCVEPTEVSDDDLEAQVAGLAGRLRAREEAEAQIGWLELCRSRLEALVGSLEAVLEQARRERRAEMERLVRESHDSARSLQRSARAKAILEGARAEWRKRASAGPVDPAETRAINHLLKGREPPQEDLESLIALARDWAETARKEVQEVAALAEQARTLVID
jgi:hypothetical protein